MEVFQLCVFSTQISPQLGVSFSAGPQTTFGVTILLIMASNSTGSTALVMTPQPSGRIQKVAPEEYREFTDEALDGEIVASVDAAHGHYDGLRRELVLRLLPALAEMRRRHSAQGARNDLNGKLGLPKRAGWGDYLRSRGLKPDTVHNWFQKYAAVKTLGLLVGGATPRKAGTRPAITASSEPRLYHVSAADRILVVAATSLRQAAATLQKSVVGLADDADLGVEEIGQVIEISNGCICKRPERRIPKKSAVSEAAILKALTRKPRNSPRAIAQQLGISVVDVRRVETRFRKQLSK